MFLRICAMMILIHLSLIPPRRFRIHHISVLYRFLSYGTLMDFFSAALSISSGSWAYIADRRYPLVYYYAVLSFREKRLCCFDTLSVSLLFICFILVVLLLQQIYMYLLFTASLNNHSISSWEYHSLSHSASLLHMAIAFLISDCARFFLWGKHLVANETSSIAANLEVQDTFRIAESKWCIYKTNICGDICCVHIHTHIHT